LQILILEKRDPNLNNTIQFRLKKNSYTENVPAVVFNGNNAGVVDLSCDEHTIGLKQNKLGRYKKIRKTSILIIL